MLNITTLWILICTTLVFLMQAGFLCLETGLTRQKNSISVGFNKIISFGTGALFYTFLGYYLIYGPSLGGVIGNPLALISKGDLADNLPHSFLFGMGFYCIATTFISGAIAERISLKSYLLIAALIATLIYPVIAHWCWNRPLEGAPVANAGGWLWSRGFVDLAGATAIHSMGGWIALAAIQVVGSRHGRYDRPNILSSFNIPMAMLGVMILFVGWLGFNGGSVGALNQVTMTVLLNTVICGAAALVTAYLIKLVQRKSISVEDLITAFLSGLVASTAGSHLLSPTSAALVGIGSAALSLLSISLLNRFQIDDAVDAIPCHLVGGIWGAFSLGLFGDLSLLRIPMSRGELIEVQSLGIITVGLWSYGIGSLALRALNHFYPLRISREAEEKGLNYSEHHATTELSELLSGMEKQILQRDFSAPMPAEPFTWVGNIASQYNRVLAVFENEKAKEQSLRAKVEQERNALFQTQADLAQITQMLYEEAVNQSALAAKNEKMALLGQHSAELSHNLQNPLMSLKLALAKLQSEARNANAGEASNPEKNLGQKCSLYLSALTSAVSKMEEIVGSILTTTRLGNDEVLQLFDLNSLIKSDLALWQFHDLFQQTKVELILNPLPHLKAVPAHFSQVINNLIRNSLEAMAHSPHKHLKITSRFEAETIELIISDSGPGIPKPLQEKIFDPFFSTKKDRPEGLGGGLGLASCRRIISSYGGKISIQSEVNSGTEFKVILPVNLQTQTVKTQILQTQASQSNQELEL